MMLAPSYAPRVGGVEKHVACVARELCRLGLEIMVVTPRWDPGWPEEDMISNVPVVRLSRSVLRGWRALMARLPWADVVHTHDAYPFLKYYLPFRLLRPRLPVFVTFHGYEAYPIPREAKLLRDVVRRLTRGNICAGAFIPKWYGFKADLITHGGVDAPETMPAPGEGAVFIGRLEKDTNFLTYLEALRYLRQTRDITLPLTVCGDGSLRLQGERLARECGLQVCFQGWVPDVRPYLAQARFACTSGLLSMLEAMAQGAIVLALHDNPLKEDYLRLFPGAAHAVIAGSAEALAAELARLMSAPEEMYGMAQRAYYFARTQTWEQVARLYVSLYERVQLRRGVA